MSAVSAPGSGRFEAAHCAVPQSEISALRPYVAVPVNCWPGSRSLKAVPPLVRITKTRITTRVHAPTSRGRNLMPIASMPSRTALSRPRVPLPGPLSFRATAA